MKLLYEKGAPGRALSILPACDVPAREIPEALARKKAPRLAHLSETEISRHYTQLAGRTHGVNDGFYPLGSCTMKYNPKIDDEMAALPGFALIHPLQPEADAQGCLEVLDALRGILTEVTGMDDMTFQPAAGAHGEQTGLLMIKAYHADRGDTRRTKVIVPDSAHGTNPASASMAGMTVVSIPSTADGCVDLEALRRAVGPDTAGLMLTNPNTLGIFDHNILEITRIVHEAGGLNYYDGANLNAIMGVVRPGDMGFDVVHLNLHKTFATPHGGGGPGAGAVGVKALLAPFLPGPRVEKAGGGYRFAAPDKSIGAVKAFYGNFLVVVRALAYTLTLGADGMRLAATTAVLNANYMMHRLRGAYDTASGDKIGRAHV
jgi:glycine dehydrogenase subunit 2